MIDVAAGGDGTLYFLTSAQSVYQMSPGGSAHLFTQVTSVSRMAGAPDGTVYLLNTAAGLPGSARGVGPSVHPGHERD